VSNVLSEEKKQQVIALGRLGWSLRRIQRETGIRRKMSRIDDAVRRQLNDLVNDLLGQKARTLTKLGLSKRRRHYLKSEKPSKKCPQLPPADAVIAALIMLRREIIVEGVPGLEAERCSIIARPQSVPSTEPQEMVQMSLLAGLDFPAEATPSIERAERKGPNRVELLVSVQLPAKTA